ncbi:MAG: hypothetical protein ACRECP_00695 [Methylocella sp.]
MNTWLTWSVLKDALLFLLALWGAALSTFNWRQAVRKERREIRVAVSTVFPTYNTGQVGEPFAMIEATNIGHRAVTVKTLTFELPTGGRMYPIRKNTFPGMSDTALPASLSDGQSAHLLMSFRDIAAGLLQDNKFGTIKLTPVCVDSAGGIYNGEPWDVDPNEFLKQGTSSV